MSATPHAIVVGASSGLGEAIARRLMQRGLTVSGLARRPSPASASFPCDIFDAASLQHALNEAMASHGVPELVVYAAGWPTMGRTLEVPRAEARRCFEVNFWGLDETVRAVVPRMAEAGKGTLLVLSSIAALRGIPYEAFYSASKAAAARYLDCLSHEAARVGVDVKYLCPGFVDTGFLERGSWFGMRAPKVSGSNVTPEDVADAALQLWKSRRRSGVLGWRERVIAISDRIAPGAYDRWRRLRRED